MELASTWPGGLHQSPASALSTVGHGFGAAAAAPIGGHFSPNFGGFSLVSSPVETHQGYAVQEDVQEDMPHDFRTQPIQTAPPNSQEVLQGPVPHSQFGISSAPFMPSLQFPAPPGFQGLEGHLRG